VNTTAETLRAAAEHPERWDVRDLMIRAADRIEDLVLMLTESSDDVEDLLDRIAELKLQVQHRDDLISEAGVR
jgi:hypothetical protein